MSWHGIRQYNFDSKHFRKLSPLLQCFHCIELYLGNIRFSWLLSVYTLYIVDYGRNLIMKRWPGMFWFGKTVRLGTLNKATNSRVRWDRVRQGNRQTNMQTDKSREATMFAQSVTKRCLRCMLQSWPTRQALTWSLLFAIILIMSSWVYSPTTDRADTN